VKDGFHAIDSDLHVIETEEVYEKFLDVRYRDKLLHYLGWSPTNFPHWDVQGQIIPPWAQAPAVTGPQQALDAPTEHLYRPTCERCYDALSTLQAMDAEGIDIATPQPLPEARATQERTLEAVGCRRLFGPAQEPGATVPDTFAPSLTPLLLRGDEVHEHAL
jgi:hypothetical protein